MKTERFSLLRERLATSKYADRADDIVEVVRGQKPLVHGMAVDVTRSTQGQRAPNGAEFHVKIAASTDGIARDCGIIPISAWENGGLRNFNNNPIILAFHSHRDPIGRSVHTELDSNNLVEYWQFHEETDLSRTMKTLYEKGYMRAASVGFLIHDVAFVDELDDKEMEDLIGKYGVSVMKDAYWIARKAELLETSAVPVPSDPKALAFSFAARNASAVGVDVADMVRKYQAAQTSRSEDEMTAEEIAALTESVRTAVLETVTTQITEVRTAITAEVATVRDEMKTVVDRVAAVEARGQETGSSTSAGTGEGAGVEVRDDQIAIELLDGETPEAAATRYADEIIAQRRGAPAPKKK